MDNLLGKDKILLQGDIRNVQLRGQHGRNVFLKARHDIPYDPVELPSTPRIYFLHTVTGSDLSNESGIPTTSEQNNITNYVEGSYYVTRGTYTGNTFSNRLGYFHPTGSSKTEGNIGTLTNGNYNLNYFKLRADSTSGEYIHYNNSPFNSIGVNSNFTIIFWIKNIPSGENNFTWDDNSYLIEYLNNLETNQLWGVRRNGNDLQFKVGVSGPFTTISNYFTTNFPIDITEWHMITMRGKNGPSNDITIDVTGKNGVKTPQVTATSGTSFYIGVGGPPGIYVNKSSAVDIDYSVFLLYLSQLTDAQVLQVFKYFAPTHGLVAGIT